LSESGFTRFTGFAGWYLWFYPENPSILKILIQTKKYNESLEHTFGLIRCLLFKFVVLNLKKPLGVFMPWGFFYVRLIEILKF